MLYSPSRSFESSLTYFAEVSVQRHTCIAMMRLLTILCIDDEALGLQVRRAVLERAGYRVITALNGETGVSLFRENPIDAVLLDYLMPGMDGGEVAMAMRRIKPEVPILLHSACVDLPHQVLSTVNGTLAKGEGAENLINRLQQIIEGLVSPTETPR
jgi:CheY-like chemotaxis protein